MEDLCPSCRTGRLGAFRFCRSCGFDFDTLGADSGAPFGRSLPGAVEGDAIATSGEGRFPARGLLALAFVVLVGVAGLSSDGMPSSGSPSSASSTAHATPHPEKPVAAAPAATPGGTLSATAKLAAGPRGTTTKAKVVRVIDGATILVAFGGKRYDVRYLGVDTPATVARQASTANEALVAGKTVILEADVSEADRSGRLLRYVWLHDGSAWTLVNLELVRRGFARFATDPRVKKYAEDFVVAEREARAHHLGLWGPVPKVKPTPRATPKPSKPAGGP